MINSDVDLHEAVISSDNYTILPPKSFDYYQTRLRFGSHSDGSIEALLKILRQLSRVDLPGKEHIEGYLLLPMEHRHDVLQHSPVQI